MPVQKRLFIVLFALLFIPLPSIQAQEQQEAVSLKWTLAETKLYRYQFERELSGSVSHEVEMTIAARLLDSFPGMFNLEVVVEQVEVKSKMWKKSLRLTSSTEKQPRSPSGQGVLYAALPLHPLRLRVQEGGKVMQLSGTDWIYEEAPEDSDPEVFLEELRSMLDFLLLPLPASPVQPKDHWEAQTQLPVLDVLPGYDLVNQRQYYVLEKSSQDSEETPRVTGEIQSEFLFPALLGAQSGDQGGGMNVGGGAGGQDESEEKKPKIRQKGEGEFEFDLSGHLLSAAQSLKATYRSEELNFSLTLKQEVQLVELENLPSEQD